MSGSQFEIFISYARRDNIPRSPNDIGWITALRDCIVAGLHRLGPEPLRVFLDTDTIVDMDDWRHRILGALRESKILLVCLSPHYFSSDNCRWEWQEYKRSPGRHLMGFDTVAVVYLEDTPRGVTAKDEEWYDSLFRVSYTDVRKWFSEGATPFQDVEACQRIVVLCENLSAGIKRARRGKDPIGNLPAPNLNFVGRGEELRRLHEQVGVGRVGVVSALHGLGGQGKSEVAFTYAHGHADLYRAGLWVLRAERQSELLRLIGTLAFEPALKLAPTLTSEQKADPALLARAVFTELQRRVTEQRTEDPDHPSAALLILDNVTEPVLLSPGQLGAIPQVDWLRLLATTRLDPVRLQGSSDRYLSLVAIDSLPEDDALGLLSAHQPGGFIESQKEETAARELVRSLGGFTLAVEQVATYLECYPDISISRFLNRLRLDGLRTGDSVSEQANVAEKIRHREKSLGVILRTTLKSLDRPARTALRVAALLPPDSVPWPWLKEVVTARHSMVGKTKPGHPDPWIAVRRKLEGLRLLTPGNEPDVARIHRLVVAFLRPESSGGPLLWDLLRYGYRSVRSCFGLSRKLRKRVTRRARAVADSNEPPASWELDALLAAMPDCFETAFLSRALPLAAIDLAVKARKYRTLESARALPENARSILQDRAEVFSKYPAAQRDLSVYFRVLAEFDWEQGNLDKAQKALMRALIIQDRVVRSAPFFAPWQNERAICLAGLGYLAKAQGNLAEARRYSSMALNVRKWVVSVDSTSEYFRPELASSFEQCGRFATLAGSLVEAEEFFRQASEIRQQLVDSDPTNLGWQDALARLLSDLGDLARARGTLIEARSFFVRALEIRRMLAAADPADVDQQCALGVSNERLGDLGIMLGDPQAAQLYHSEYFSIAKRLAESDPHKALWRSNLSDANAKLACLAFKRGDLDEAERLLVEAVEDMEQFVEVHSGDADSRETLTFLCTELGEAYFAQKKLNDAGSLFAKGLTIARSLAESDVTNAYALRQLAVCLTKSGELASARGPASEAKRFHEEALKIDRRLIGIDPSNTAWYRALTVGLFKFAEMALEERNRGEAQRFFKQALENAELLYNFDPTNAEWRHDLVACYSALGGVAFEEGNVNEAKAQYCEALRIAQPLLPSPERTELRWLSRAGLIHRCLIEIGEAQQDPELVAFHRQQLLRNLQEAQRRGLSLEREGQRY
jgi:tetratricopeptide (TPR) repeat protein